ncbi:tripartite tricarboxylate transporter substrate binding protein [Verticiella sediminum]|uniref:Tripartite tricarboxylate transporter substrate binding protein n=1 Tax=Verticiella sediminum TaxID=1247510 RepID=A0A556AQA3_9BURK|nr:tripartite tricarboxylate transporter substrate binding protein [Verticiella sediminum]TSH95087.1 tripartite tricarboxylate transporter substrate binding protein [Verticiella sediminum]
MTRQTRTVTRWRHGLRALALGLVAALGATTGAGAAAAATFPSQPIRLVVPFPPGGPSDVTARAISSGMSQALGQPVVVENRPGAGAVLASESVLNSAHDGHTLLMASNILSTGKALYPNLRFDPARDFRAVAGVFKSPHVVVVAPTFPGDGIQDLLRYADEHGEAMDYASSGAGTMPHLGTELFKQLTGAPMRAIPYKGSSPALIAVMSGEVPVYFDILLSAQNLVRTGKLKPLAVTSAERLAQFPNVPTVMEQGVADFELYSWFGIVVPSDVPDAVVERLNEAVNEAMRTPAFARQLETLAALPIGGEAAEFQAMIEQDTELWGRTIEKAGITLE